jgi:hypothetical protein
MEREMQKYVTVLYDDIIPELGDIQGPILNPTWLELSVIRSLIYGRKTLYEHCLAEPQKRVLLTKQNYSDLNIYPGNAAIEDLSGKPNTYILGFEDTPNKDDDMAAGYVYVEFM